MLLIGLVCLSLTGCMYEDMLSVSNNSFDKVIVYQLRNVFSKEGTFPVIGLDLALQRVLTENNASNYVIVNVIRTDWQHIKEGRSLKIRITSNGKSEMLELPFDRDLGGKVWSNEYKSDVLTVESASYKVTHEQLLRLINSENTEVRILVKDGAIIEKYHFGLYYEGFKKFMKETFHDYNKYDDAMSIYK